MSGRIFSPSIVDEVSQFTEGTLVIDDDGKAWVYAKATSNVSAHHVVRSTTEWGVSHLTNSNDQFGRRLGVPLVDIPDDHFGWVQVFGRATIQVAADCAGYTQLYSTGDAGQVDDDSSGNNSEILGITLGNTQGGSAGLNTFGQLHWPQMYE